MTILLAVTGMIISSVIRLDCVSMHVKGQYKLHHAIVADQQQREVKPDFLCLNSGQRRKEYPSAPAFTCRMVGAPETPPVQPVSVPAFHGNDRQDHSQIGKGTRPEGERLEVQVLLVLHG